MSYIILPPYVSALCYVASCHIVFLVALFIALSCCMTFSQPPFPPSSSNTEPVGLCTFVEQLHCTPAPLFCAMPCNGLRAGQDSLGAAISLSFWEQSMCTRCKEQLLLSIKCSPIGKESSRSGMIADRKGLSKAVVLRIACSLA